MLLFPCRSIRGCYRTSLPPPQQTPPPKKKRRRKKLNRMIASVLKQDSNTKRFKWTPNSYLNKRSFESFSVWISVWSHLQGQKLKEGICLCGQLPNKIIWACRARNNRRHPQRMYLWWSLCTLYLFVYQHTVIFSISFKHIAVNLSIFLFICIIVVCTVRW